MKKETVERIERAIGTLGESASNKAVADKAKTSVSSVKRYRENIESVLAEAIKPVVEWLKTKQKGMPEPLIEKWAELLLKSKGNEFRQTLGIALEIEAPEENVILPDHLQKLLAQGQPVAGQELETMEPHKDTSKFKKA